MPPTLPTTYTNLSPGPRGHDVDLGIDIDIDIDIDTNPINNWIVVIPPAPPETANPTSAPSSLGGRRQRQRSLSPTPAQRNLG
jgi:hypothetical protein